jgi:hypothetical protein
LERFRVCRYIAESMARGVMSEQEEEKREGRYYDEFVESTKSRGQSS